MRLQSSVLELLYSRANPGGERLRVNLKKLEGGKGADVVVHTLGWHTRCIHNVQVFQVKKPCEKKSLVHAQRTSTRAPRLTVRALQPLLPSLPAAAGNPGQPP